MLKRRTPMMKSFLFIVGISVFITASDTDAGKTFVTASLARALTAAGLKICALKPVCCGCSSGQINPDIEALLRAQKMPDTQKGAINLYDFAAFSAPDQAAKDQGLCIEPEKLTQWCAARVPEHDITLIEGVGGLMVPLARNFMVSDWLTAMPGCMVVLVVRVKLGGINHALLTLKHLQYMGRDPAWVIINDVDHTDGKLLRHHVEAMVPRLKSGTRMLSLPHRMGMERTAILPQLRPLLADITQKVCSIHGGWGKDEGRLNPSLSA